MAKIPEEKRVESDSDSGEEETDGSSSAEGSSDSESETEQAPIARKPSSLPPAAAKKSKSKPSTTKSQKPSTSADEEESGSESESEADSASESDGSEPKVEQVAPKPAADPPKSKSVAKKSTASPAVIPTKSTGKKRVAEEKQSAVKDSKKKLKTEPEDSDQNTKDDTKKQLFRRLWSEEDQIALLKGMAEYTEKKKSDPSSDLESFHLFIKDNLLVAVTRSQLQDKIRRLKKKYETNKMKDEDSKGKTFSKPHEQRMYELSERVWEKKNGEENGVRKRASAKKTSGMISNGVDENGEHEDVKKVVLVDSNGEFDNVNMTFPNYSSTEDMILKNGAKMFEGRNVLGMRQEWRGLRLEEVELYLRRLEVMRAQTKLVLDGLKSENL